MTDLPILAITQRVAVDPVTGERRDALDQRWAGFTEQAGARLLVLPNHPEAATGLFEDVPCAGLVLSGGNNIGRHLRTASGAAARVDGEGSAPERDRTESALIAAAVTRDLPILGVCRGFQVLNLFHGGALREMPAGHVATRHALAFAPRAAAAEPDANSYHDWGMVDADLPPAIEVLARAGEVVEMGRHVTLPHLGVMWHPEREPQFRRFDLDLFRRHFELCEPA